MFLGIAPLVYLQIVINDYCNTQSIHSTFGQESSRLGEKQGGGDFFNGDFLNFQPSGRIFRIQTQSSDIRPDPESENFSARHHPN